MDAATLDWLSRRSFRAREWTVRRLVLAKQDTTVSVVVPALDEEARVGNIVAAIRRELVERHPLVDELVVMDSGSTDATVSVARAAGAQVFHREDVLSSYFPRPGKGEVLWRSLAATTGDVVVFIDGDLRDFSTLFVTGLLGPLLCDSSIDFVKAAYDRPLQQGVSSLATGGGRVTELVARPLLAMHWPPLAAFVQPLGGEYAVRRSLLEQLPFAGGYGVEIGLLIDAFAAVGLDRMAQVDVIRRKHRNGDLHKLGRMATEILQTIHARLGQPPAPVVLPQFTRGRSGFRLVETEVNILDRPPIASLRDDGAG